MVDLTPAAIVQTLSQIGKALDEQAGEVERLHREHVQAKAAYRSAFARAFLTAEGAMDVRRYQAEQATADEFLAMELSEQVWKAAIEAQRVLRDRLEIGRSLSSVMKLEWGNG